MENDSYKGYDYASIEEFENDLTGKDIKKTKKHNKDTMRQYDDPVGIALKGVCGEGMIEGFDSEMDNMSMLVNQETDSNYQEDNNEETPIIEPMSLVNEEIPNESHRSEILKNFWEKYKLWLIIAIVIVVIILFMLVYILITAEPKGNIEPINLIPSKEPILDSRAKESIRSEKLIYPIRNQKTTI